jgi:uncharacterized protein (TIGR03083 family)
MEHEEYVASVAGDVDGLIEAVAAGASGVPVPTCPGWSVADLTEHVGQFCGFWAHVLCEGTGRPKTPFRDGPGDDAAGWLRELGGSLVAELAATPRATEVWTWYDPDQSAAFVARRCAHELAVHRYDAQSARGTCRPIPAALAADGIDEVLTILVEARPRSGQAAGESMHLHATDTGADWFVTLHPDRVGVDHRASPADLTLRGPASDLELVLYGRPTLDRVDHEGDDDVLEGWRGEFLF